MENLCERCLLPDRGCSWVIATLDKSSPGYLAHLSKDENLCRLFNDGIDFHQFTADKLGISRDRAKVLNLSVGYRATFKSVSQQLKCSDRRRRMKSINGGDSFLHLRRWQDELIYEQQTERLLLDYSLADALRLSRWITGIRGVGKGQKGNLLITSHKAVQRK